MYDVYVGGGREKEMVARRTWKRWVYIYICRYVDMYDVYIEREGERREMIA